MTPGLAPVVRYLIGCENVQRDPQESSRYTLVGLLAGIRASATPPYPFCSPDFFVYVQVTSCRGPGRGGLDIVSAEPEEVVFQRPERPLAFGADPLNIYTSELSHSGLCLP